MILVNNPGGGEVYAPLRHAEWNGWTPADLIFPFFLFVIGVAITFSQASGRGSGERGWRLWAALLRRSALLIALGLFLNGFPLFDLSELRLPGVLQRIGLCYLAASAAAATLTSAALLGLWGTLVAGYWMLVDFVPGSTTALAPDANLGAWIDAALMHGHLLHETWDPEGLLGTLPAIATTLSGVLAGRWLRAAPTPARRLAGLAGAGSAALLLGLALDPWCPINKNLWSSSFVLFSGGAALCALALCHWLVDVKGWRGAAMPFIAYGANPIVAYVLSSLIAKEMLLWHVASAAGASIDLQEYVFARLFAPWTSAAGASLLYALAYVLVWLGVAAFLYRRGAFIKI